MDAAAVAEDAAATAAAAGVSWHRRHAGALKINELDRQTRGRLQTAEHRAVEAMLSQLLIVLVCVLYVHRPGKHLSNSLKLSPCRPAIAYSLLKVLRQLRELSGEGIDSTLTRAGNGYSLVCKIKRMENLVYYGRPM